MHLTNALCRAGRIGAQLFDAQQAHVVGVKPQPRMIFMRHAQHFGSELFQREQHFGFVFENYVQIRPFEFDDDIGIFDLRPGVVADLKREVDIPIGFVENRIEEVLNPRPVLFDGVFPLGHCVLSRVSVVGVYF